MMKRHIIYAAAIVSAAFVICLLVWLFFSLSPAPQAQTVTVAEPPEERYVVLTHYEGVDLPADLQNYIKHIGSEHDIDPKIIIAIIVRESECDITAVGDNGQAFGLMQIHPRWHYQRMLDLNCTNLHDGYQNVAVGVHYLAELRDRYGEMAKALTAYNRGSYTGVTTAYAQDILAAAEQLTEASVRYPEVSGR